MSLKLIRQAQAVSRLGNDQLQLARHVQGVLNKTNITEVFDGKDFEVTPDHYTQWLETLLDMAREQGVSVDKKQVFNEIAFEILDNDSFIDALSSGNPSDTEQTKEAIVKTLWQTYQVNKAHARTQQSVGSHIDRAHEDEQALRNIVGENSIFAQAFNAAKGVEDEQSGMPRAKPKNVYQQAVASKVSRNNPYPKNSLRASIWADMYGEENEEVDPIDRPSQEPDSVPPAEDVDTSIMSVDDIAARVMGRDDEADPQDSDSQAPADDVESRVDDLEARVADLEGTDDADVDQMKSPSDVEDADDTGGDLPPEDDEALPSDDMEQRPAPTRSFDDEEAVKQLFHRAITSPKTHLSAALKDVEDAGKSAWTGVSMPRNPHPKMSQAYKAWQKGFRAAAQDGLGFAKKPVDTSKQKAKRR